MDERERRMSRFGRGLIIYICVFLLIAAVLLGILYGFVGAYEKSRPYNCVEAFLDGIYAYSLPEECEKYVMSLDETVYSSVEAKVAAAAILSGSAYKKDVKNSSEQSLCYNLSKDGNYVGRVFMEQTGHSSFGMRQWEPAGLEFDLSAFEYSKEITVPEGYTVSVNGKKLGEACIRDTEVPYDKLKSCYQYYEDTPSMISYSTGKYLCLDDSETELRIQDEKGRTVESENQNEQYYLDNCDEELKKELEEFSGELINRYVQLCASMYGAEYSNYNRIMELVVPESQLSVRMEKSFAALGFSYVASCNINEITMNLCSDLGQRYFTDLHYVTEIVGYEGPVTTEQNIQLVIIRDENNELKAEAMFNY